MKFTPPPLSAPIERHDQFLALLEEARTYPGANNEEIDAYVSAALKRRALAVKISVGQDGIVRIRSDTSEAET